MDERSSRARLGRRDLLRGGSIGLAVLATGCSRKPSAPFSCTDVSSLSPGDASARAALAYAEPTPNLTKSCSSCQQYLGPPDGQGCGSCKVLKGPVHPAGTCKAFVPKMM
jgi:hypothetical protein